MKKIIYISLIIAFCCQKLNGQNTLDFNFLFNGKFETTDQVHFYRIIGDSILLKKSPWHSYVIQTNGGFEVLNKLKTYDRQFDTIRVLSPKVNDVSSGKNISYDKSYAVFMKNDALPEKYYKELPEIRGKSQFNLINLLNKKFNDKAINITKLENIKISLSSFNDEELILKTIIAEGENYGEEKYEYFINTKFIYEFLKTYNGNLIKKIRYSSTKTYPNDYKFEEYQNKHIKLSGEYVNLQKSGKWKHYNDEGKLIKTEKYKNDTLLE